MKKLCCAKFINSFIHCSLILSLAVVFVSCTPALTYKQLKPARFNLGKDPSFILGKVDVKPDLKFNTGGGLVGALANVAANMVATWATSDDLRKSMEDAMRSAIAANQFATYTYNNATYKIDLSGVLKVEDESEKKKEEKTKDGKKYQVTVYEVKRKYELELRYEVINNKGGNLVGASSHTLKDEESQTADSEKEASEKLKDWTEFGKDMMEEIMKPIMKEILPYFEIVKIKLRKGKNPEIKAAAKMAKRNEIDNAREKLVNLQANESSLIPKDRANLHYNLGALFEREDKLQEAENEYNICLKEFNDKWCTKGLNRVKERATELDRLKESGL